jgi:hypothetical protein
VTTRTHTRTRVGKHTRRQRQRDKLKSFLTLYLEARLLAYGKQSASGKPQWCSLDIGLEDLKADRSGLELSSDEEDAIHDDEEILRILYLGNGVGICYCLVQGGLRTSMERIGLVDTWCSERARSLRIRTNPECSIAQRTAHSIVSALGTLRDEPRAAIPQESLPSPAPSSSQILFYFIVLSSRFLFALLPLVCRLSYAELVTSSQSSRLLMVPH